MPGLIKFNGAKRPNKTRTIEMQPEDVWLNTVIDKHLTGIMTPSRSGIFHPSTLSNKCDRAVWLTYYGKMPKAVLDPKLNRVFQNGSYLENLKTNNYEFLKFVGTKTNDMFIIHMLDYQNQ